MVAADERDRGRRAVLNLGHTVGHAIEAATGYGRYRHGEAVGLGLLATLRLSGADELRDEVGGILARHGLPTALGNGIGADEVLAAVELDKKRTADGVGVRASRATRRAAHRRHRRPRPREGGDRRAAEQLVQRSRNRVAVLHGVNLDMLGRRDPEHYGTVTLAELQTKVKRYAGDLDLEATFFQTNHEGEFVEYLHRLPERADAALLNPGAWTHYSYAIRDAVEIAAVPAVEVHLSNVDSREEWRKSSVLDGLVIDVVSGEGRRVPARARDPQRETENVSRAGRLAGLAGERELDQLLVGDLVRPGDSDRRGMANLRYLTGFTGTSGLCLVGERWKRRRARSLPHGLPLHGARGP